MKDFRASFQDKAGQFWIWFSKNKEILASVKTNNDPILGIAIERLHNINEGLFLEVATNSIPKEFVITAAGKSELFALVDLLIASAPSIQGWLFVALKPTMGFDFQTDYKGYVYNPKEIWFLPLIKRSDPSYLGLRLGLANMPACDKKDIYSAISTILETGLGERPFAKEIKYIEIGDLPANPAREGYMELKDLSEYISWRKTSGQQKKMNSTSQP